MRVAVYYNNRDLRIEERPVPPIGTGEILLKVEASGICGSDVMEWYRIKKAPLVLGHEVTGTIEKVGLGVERYKVGDRVFVSHHVPCNTCRYCLKGHHAVCDTLRTTNFDPGGFAEFIRVPAINVDRGVFHLPNGMTFDEGTLIEPLACALRALRLARFRSGQSVLVLGSGVSGLLFVILSRTMGSGPLVVTDINEYRLEAARRFGAHVVFNPKEAKDGVPDKVRQVNNGSLADLVLVCTGAPQAISEAWQSVDRGGTIVFFAPAHPEAHVTIPVNDLWKNEVSILTSYAAAPSDIAKAIELMRSYRVHTSGLITHRLGMDEIGRGFQLVAGAQESLKVVIEPQR